MGGGGGGEGELGYEETQAWRLAVFFVGFLLISVGGESLLHKLEHHAKEKKMHGLNETVKKCKDELMLLGFISMLLVICQENILGICVPDSWDPTNATVAGAQRRALASIEVECPEGRVQFITISALHQVHIFIFLMGLSHIVTGSVTMVLCMARIKKWRQWESYGDSFEAVLRGTQRAAPSGRRASLGTKANIERMRRSSITTLASDEAMTKEEWMLKAITEPNSKCMATTRDLFLGGDMLMYLYLRRYFIRKHRRKQDFDFLKYITQCMADEYAKTMDLSAGDWTVATLTVLLRDYYFSLWFSLATLLMSVLVGVKLSEIARMIVSDTRDMVLLPSAGNSSDTGGDKSPSAHSDASSNSTGTPVKGLQLETMEMIQQHFAEADADASGSLSNDEIKTLLQEMIPGFEPDPAYLQELFSRFDCDSTGSIEVDEFARMYKFLQQHTGGVAESPKSSGGQTTPLKKLAKSFSRGSNKVLPPKLKRGTIRWLCNRWGPRVHPSKLRQIIRIIMFQNAMVVTQLIFSLWQIGASESSYFSEPTGWPAGSFGVQALLALLQLLHSAFLTLPMYSIVMQMGHHYNVRIFGMTAKMVVAWADKAKKSRTKKKLGVGSVATSSFRGRLVKLSSKVQPSPAQLAAAGEDAEVGVKRAAAQRATSGSGSPGLLRRSRTPTVAVLPSDESAEEGGGGGSIRPLELAPGLSAKYRVDGGGGGNEEPEDWLESAQRSVHLEENQDAAGEQGPEISPAPPPPPDDDGPQAAP